ncbi:MAG: hypothetical protein ACKV22_05070 [Bryobacteraceae bacterium]
MPETQPCNRFYRWGSPKGIEKSRSAAIQIWSGRWRPSSIECTEWRSSDDRLNLHAIADAMFTEPRSSAQILWSQLAAKIAVHSEADLLCLRAERLRPEFETLAERWRRDTQHLSLISRKVAHPAYFRIMGMGEAVVPLLLEALRDKPAHWFVALQATANANPAPDGASPSTARQAWLDWGRANGLVE